MDSVADLQALDEKYQDCMYKLFGSSLIGFPMDADSSRLNMLNSNIKQILNPVNPQPARIQTRYENIFGKHSSAYKRLDGSWEVTHKIHKFPRSGTKSYVYMLVIYNKDTNTYDMIERCEAENLVEKFGYLYNNDTMDSLEPGDVVVDDVLYKSTSFDDENMNYNLGFNALTMYQNSTSNIEDAILIRKGFAESVLIPEVDSIIVTINDNDVLLNIHGDDDNYKPLPEIGEILPNSYICATRRIVKEKLLSAFQTKNIRKIFSTDVPYVSTSKNTSVYDINIYYNNDDPFPDNVFFAQVKEYYDQCCEYADSVSEVARTIKNSGANFTQNVTYYLSKYQQFNDAEYKWNYKGKEFSNMIIELKTKSILSLAEGYKMVGRYGDKGVISDIGRTVTNTPMYNGLELSDDITKLMEADEITDELINDTKPNVIISDDEDMPYLEDGRRIDLVLNAPGAIRRLNTGQWIELDLNFIAEGIRRHLPTLKTNEEKVEMIFKFLSYLEQDQYELFKKYYESLSQELEFGGIKYIYRDQKAMDRFVSEVEEKGFYLAKYPDSHIRYDTIKALYEEFDFIKPLPIYVDRFGIKGIRCMWDAVVGEKYMYILKQTSGKQFSARSTGRIDRKNLPQKSSDKKNNRSTYSETPIMIGEPYNLWTDISGLTLAEYSLFMRSSPLARKDLGKILAAKGNPLDVDKIEIQDTYVNNNAMIFNQYFKGIGARLHFITTDSNDIDISASIVPISVYGNLIYDVPGNKEKYMTLYEKFYETLKTIEIEESYEGEKRDVAWFRTLEIPEVKDLRLSEGILSILGSTVTANPDPNSVNTEIYLTDDPEAVKKEVHNNRKIDTIVIPQEDASSDTED